jgi:hypothetical protein
MRDWKKLAEQRKVAYFPTHSPEALSLAHSQRTQALTKEIRAARETSQDVASKIDVAAGGAKSFSKKVVEKTHQIGEKSPEHIRSAAGNVIPPSLLRDLGSLGDTAIDTAAESAKSVLSDRVPVSPIARGVGKVIETTKGHFEDPHNTMYYHNLQRSLAAKAEALAGNPTPLAQEMMHQYGEKPLKAISKAVGSIKDKLKKKAEILSGGKGDNKPDSSFSKEQLMAGVKTELEHTKSKSLAKEIAKDHLTERKDYYRRLSKAGL